ncbi:lamin tail domain-containing protein [Massilibacteroides vaginae]|uniref:lamin tail domain-containing protein n=1 Tax=Massilibacteroides vaginae TaxID=1673718 RepID=UPI000A1C9E1E|nr:lamin tail domain-containing protein [Massilibacteroides vaginae]
MKQLFLFFAFLLPFCIHAQLHDAFDNVDIAHKYPWKGDVDRFVIENGFMRLNARAQKDKAAIYLYGATLNENEWNFRVKSGYRTTSANYMRIYLWSDSCNFSNQQSAYYVEIGGGQVQKISLCKKKAWESPSALISKPINNLDNPFDIHIRVVADKEEIKLYARLHTKTDFTEIGSSYYTPEVNPGYFILYCNYSTDHAKNKYFGPVDIKNFSVTEPALPVKPTELSVLTLKQEDASTILLTFNQAVDPQYASFVLTSLGEVDEIYWSEDETQVRLIWYGAMENGKAYTLTYENLYDSNRESNHSTLSPFIATAEVTDNESSKPVTSQYSKGDILINEVMANPNGAKGLPETEYVELHNTTNEAIDLTGWSFYYAAKATLLKSAIPAKGYAVLFREGRAVEVDNGGVSIPLATFPSALANTGKQLLLTTKEGVLIDDITYTEAKPGCSWERIGEGWQYSSDERGGTPGSKNSTTDQGENAGDSDQVVVLPYEIVFSELLPEPQVGGSEYIELYNRSKRTLPLNGLAVAVRKSDGTLSTNYALSSLAEPLDAGEYCVLTKNAAGVLDYFLVPSPEKINEVKLPILANTSSELVLFRSKDKEVIDEVHYSEKWHSSSVKNKKGVALEKIDLDGNSQDPDNWTSASSLSGGGTPGYANSQGGTNGGGNPTGIQDPEFITATGTYEIAYRLDRAGYICRASIYDTSGRKITEIVNQELLGTEGIISWNGFATGGNKPSTGVYIFHAELHHPQGGRKTYKKVFLVK